MKRDIDQQLLDWKHDSARRALLVRGARQVGKTYSVRELGRTFAHYLEVNFEEHPDVCLFFRDSPDPIRLREKLAAYYSTPIVPGETLLFLDEIQSCPEAFSSLSASSTRRCRTFMSLQRDRFLSWPSRRYHRSALAG